MNTPGKKFLIVFILLGLAAISPNLFVAAQAGVAPFSTLALNFLLPSIAMVIIIVSLSKFLKYTDIYHLAVNGILAGLIATVALEIFRESGFRLGTMPGALPRLMGVLILNQFSSGPDTLSDLAGWSYHFWNGAAFGLIYSLLFGQGKLWQGLVYGLLIGVGFMISPVVKSLGIGLWGLDFKDGYQFALTVTLAHVAFGLTLSFLLMRWNKDVSHIWVRLRSHT